MYGLCVLNRFTLWICVFFFSTVVWAQSQQGTVIEETQIYQDADFDAPVIAVVKPGGVYSISTKKKGPFYKIKIKQGMIGWIADSDIHVGVIKNSASAQKKKIEEERERERDTRRPFFATRYWGPAFEYMNYTEDTMGKERTAGLLFYGLKWSGYNTLIGGEIYTDSNLLIYSGAPSYYKDVTGQSAGGFIVNANFLFQTINPITPSALYFYGFGPALRYSHFDLHLPNGATTIGYSADDMALGAVFDFGLAFRLSRVSLRADAKYYWEKNKYFAGGASLGFEF